MITNDDQITDYREQVESHLETVLPDPDEPPARLHEAMRYAVLNGGKRIRPLLTLATGKMFTTETGSLLGPASAVELVHAYSLVHDDLPCMDDDDLRRGKPSCHRKFDEATAVLTGDALLTLAFSAISNSDNTDKTNRLCSELALWAGSKHLVGGQQMDLDPGDEVQSREDLRDLHRRKTGGLITAAIRMGAIAGGAPESDLERLTKAARSLGLAFQIVDDVLDVTGTKEELGKEPGKDRDNDRVTYPELIGVEDSEKAAKNHLDHVLSELEPFGDDARLLRETAKFIVERNH